MFHSTHSERHHQYHKLGARALVRSNQDFHHTGLAVIGQACYRSWQIILERRTVGMTFRRVQYSARIIHEGSSREEYLAGFNSKQAATTAAHRRIDFILDIQMPRHPWHHFRARRVGNRGYSK